MFGTAWDVLGKLVDLTVECGGNARKTTKWLLQDVTVLSENRIKTLSSTLRWSQSSHIHVVIFGLLSCPKKKKKPLKFGFNPSCQKLESDFKAEFCLFVCLFPSSPACCGVYNVNHCADSVTRRGGCVLCYAHICTYDAFAALSLLRSLLCPLFEVTAWREKWQPMDRKWTKGPLCQNYFLPNSIYLQIILKEVLFAATPQVQVNFWFIENLKQTKFILFLNN